MYNKTVLPVPRNEILLTGIGEKRKSKYSGNYRYLFAIGPDGNALYPSSLSNIMENNEQWNMIVKLLEQKKKLYCKDAVLIKRKGKIMMDCDFVPTVIEMGDEIVTDNN